VCGEPTDLATRPTHRGPLILASVIYFDHLIKGQVCLCRRQPIVGLVAFA
jgi:hypothetical protein